MIIVQTNKIKYQTIQWIRLKKPVGSTRYVTSSCAIISVRKYRRLTIRHRAADLIKLMSKLVSKSQLSSDMISQCNRQSKLLPVQYRDCLELEVSSHSRTCSREKPSVMLFDEASVL